VTGARKEAKVFWFFFSKKNILAFLNRLRRRRRPDVRVTRGYQKWLAREAVSLAMPNGPRISVVLPVFDAPAPFLRAAIASVLAQTFGNWQLCIADDASPSPHVQDIIAEFLAGDARISAVRLAENAGIAAATNAGFSLASGEFVALLDHDDELAPHALACVAGELAAHPEAWVMFSDEDQLVEGRRCRPYFKPGWNPDRMVSQNLVSHLGIYRRVLVEAIGGMREGFDGSQDYDFALRAIAAVTPERVRHIPRVLYHWRQHKESFSAIRAQKCQDAARRALASCLGGSAKVVANPDISQWTRVIYPVPSETRVSIIVAGGQAPPADPEFTDVEILADAAGASGDVLVFLVPDLVPHRSGWLRELLGQALRPEIGCAGGRLDFPDGRICHSGFFLDPKRVAQTLAPGSDYDDPGYFGHFLLARSVAAVSRDCMAVRREVFEAAGGFDQRAGMFADVDFCLRVGKRCVWTPHARLRYRHMPRARVDLPGIRFMRARWPLKDPYLNPNLVLVGGNLKVAARKKQKFFGSFFQKRTSS
jgi:GT2 family glycosyltransferase